MTRVPLSPTDRTWLLAALVIGLVVRLAIWTATGGLDARIIDERQYLELAASLSAGKGFAWVSGDLTSLRPPLYPALVAGLWQLTGVGDLQAVRLLQFLLALLTAGITYEIGARALGPRIGAIAAAIAWLYPSLVFLNFNILAETLFTLLLAAFVLFSVMLVQHPRAAAALACGAALGLGALTRSVLWPVPLVLCPLLLVLIPGTLARRVAFALLVLASYGAIVVPWAVRNTRLQRVVTIVDTMGGMNLRMGNYEHTPEDRMWDAVSITGERSWVYALAQDRTIDSSSPHFTEGMKEKWAQRKALEYMRAHPGTTLRRAMIKFSDFWGLEREFVAAVTQRMYVPPRWFAIVAIVLTLTASAALLLLAAAGIFLSPPAWRAHVLMLLPIVITTGVHAIVFGHSRYHLPLVPVLAVYGAGALTCLARGCWRGRPLATAAAGGAALLLVAIWVRQIVVVDGERVRAMLGGWW